MKLRVFEAFAGYGSNLLPSDYSPRILAFLNLKQYHNQIPVSLPHD